MSIGIKEKYYVTSIAKEQTKPWLLHKHYHKRMPMIKYSFGLYELPERLLRGVCTLGNPCVMMNYGQCIFENYSVYTTELNRLVVNEGVEKNVLSYFVSQTLKLLPTPICVVSFADPNNGHQGYIYQASNFIYTGISEPGGKNCDWVFNDRNYHGKAIVELWFTSRSLPFDKEKTLKENFTTIGGVVREFGLKHRYMIFLGNKHEKKNMKKELKYDILPYPKGDNTRYDASFMPTVQGVLF